MQYDLGEMARICSGRLAQLDVVSNNLANVGTPGFKVEHLYPDRKKEDGGSGASPYASSLLADFSQGIMQPTGNPLDVAIQGEGFFVVQTPAGPAYTRKGNFLVNRQKQLVTQSGAPVLGEKGPLILGGKNVTIDSSGTITVDGAVVDRLKMVRFTELKALARQGEGLFSDPGSAGVQKMEKAEVSPGQLEMSNVNAVKEMVDMIGMHRSFESYQKVIQMMSEIDKLSASRVGRLA